MHSYARILQAATLEGSTAKLRKALLQISGTNVG